MAIQIKVFIPFFDILCSLSRYIDISSIGDLLEVIWEEEGGCLKGEEVEISQLSIRSLVYPVPMEPRDTLQKRVAYSARVNGSTDTGNKDEVPSSWCDPENLHVYLCVDSGPEVRVAEHLYNTLWGKDLNVILEEVSDDDGTTWKYVPETHIDSLRMEVLGYPESRGLLVRPEYDIALGMLNDGYKTAKNHQRGGVVVTGQPGIGRTCFLYYLLLHKLSEMEPVALERPGFFILFHDGGVYTLPLNAEAEYIPDGTWALSDGNDEPYQPCSVFRTASKRQTAWVIQTTSQVEARWRRWRKYSRADLFVMNHVSIEEITALSKVFNLDVGNTQHLYRKWGPSAARTCIQLLLEGEEGLHEREVMKAAGHFVHDPHTIASLDESRVSGLLFSIQPMNLGRRVQIPEIATDHIKEIISYAAADAVPQDQIKFFHSLSTKPSFRASAEKMFEGFVLSWLYTCPNAEPLLCFATDQVDLEIPACGKEQTIFFDNTNSSRSVNGDRLPLCLLPKAQTFPTACAIVITDEFVITIQVILSHRHETKGGDLDVMKEVIPPHVRRDKWRHVFITNNYSRALSLRSQTLPELPTNALVYSAEFNIEWSGVTRRHVEALNKKKLQPPCEGSMEDDVV